ncbi:protein pinocchio-like [Haemaphysalis longicornis]
MATGVLLGYPTSPVYETRPLFFQKGKRITHSKSEPVLTVLQRKKSLARCSDQHNFLWEAELGDPILSPAALLEGAEFIAMHCPEIDYRSCFTCGVSWCEGHVSLDCFECGGYAMQRPCVHCDGHCGGVWKRDLAASHKLQHAQWFGVCKHVPSDATLKSYDT